MTRNLLLTRGYGVPQRVSRTIAEGLTSRSVSQSPLTVVFVAWAPFFSGAERALIVLAENLDPSRYRPVVIVGTDAELAAELRSRQIFTVHLPIEYLGLRNLAASTVSVGRFLSLARRERGAIFHANDLPSFQ